MTAIAALTTALWPYFDAYWERASGTLGTESGPTSALLYSCSDTQHLSTQSPGIHRFDMKTGRYPVSIQLFFKPSLAEMESFAMYPLPTTVQSGGSNPMNIYTDGGAVLISIVTGPPLFARYDAAANRWDEFQQGYVYACAIF